LELKLNIENDIILKGEYYPHIADLFRIFLDNALTHSQQSISIIPIEIDVELNNKWALIKIANKFPDPLKINNLSTENDQNLSIIKLSTEDKSGLYKASKILKSDLKFEQNECKREIDKDGRYSVDIKINIENLRI
jgi:hypothetical protein